MTRRAATSAPGAWFVPTRASGLGSRRRARSRVAALTYVRFVSRVSQKRPRPSVDENPKVPSDLSPVEYERRVAELLALPVPAFHHPALSSRHATQSLSVGVLRRLRLHFYGREILKRIKAHPDAWPFAEPVDPIWLEVPTYWDEVRRASWG